LNSFFFSYNSNTETVKHLKRCLKALVHGNVKEVIQDVPIDSLPTNNISTQYEYELISGNMKKVSYQKEKIDQITHEYKYDNLNRLTDVLSSIDDIHYHREASYTY
jgi:hypothetical protein